MCSVDEYFQLFFFSFFFVFLSKRVCGFLTIEIKGVWCCSLICTIDVFLFLVFFFVRFCFIEYLHCTVIRFLLGLFLCVHLNIWKTKSFDFSIFFSFIQHVFSSILIIYVIFFFFCQVPARCHRRIFTSTFSPTAKLFVQAQWYAIVNRFGVHNMSSRLHKNELFLLLYCFLVFVFFFLFRFVATDFLLMLHDHCFVLFIHFFSRFLLLWYAIEQNYCQSNRRRMISFWNWIKEQLSPLLFAYCIWYSHCKERKKKKTSKKRIVFGWNVFTL